ncbi:MAG: hypothetical protein Q7J16_12660 [Candidatus Cloacimonadales bacterium]|nr:hypothetical protein [Candidatus Cloacimonadales bacterium]
MKKIIILIFIFILTSSIIFAQTENPERKEFLKIKYDQNFFSISPVISPRICYGLVKSTKQSDDRYFESIYYLHAFETLGTYRVYGFAYRGNAFVSKNRRSGLYLLLNVGLDYLKFGPLFAAPGGGTSDSGIKSILFPNLAVGLGYSLRIKNNSYLRLEWDIGLKWLGSNLYLSFIW